MKPVEIEFLMKDRLSGGIDNARMKSDLLDASLKRIALTVGGAFTIDKAIQFGKVMMDVRGQIESYNISFDTLIGNREKAAAFFSELKEFAIDTPLMLDDLAKNAQTFLGFGIETERVIPILKQIGDVTMGNKERFSAMSLAFAQMYATGRLQGQDLLQMINAGFNPLIAISERTGKSVSQLKEEMSEGAISAEMVAQAFADVTAEGGKFNGMLEKQSLGWNGIKSNFEDAVQDMINDMGSKAQGVFSEALQTSTTLVKNYESVGKELVALIGVYGTYKAAMIAITTIEKQRFVFNKLVADFIPLETSLRKGATAAMIQEAAAARALNTMKQNLMTSTKMLAKSLLPNPYVLSAMAVASLAYGIYKLTTYQTSAEKAQIRLNDSAKEFNKSILNEERELAQLSGKLKAATKGSEEWLKIKTQIVDKFGQYKSNLDDEITKVGDLSTVYQTLSENIRKSYGARQYENFIKDEQSNFETLMTDKLSDVQEQLIKKLGMERGTEIYTKLREAIVQGTVKAGVNGFNDIKGIPTDVKKELDNISGASGNDVFQNFKIEGWIKEIISAQKVLDNIDKKAKNLFGVGTPTRKETPADKDDEPLISTSKKNKEYWEQQKKTAVASLEAMDVSEKGTAKWISQTKKIAEAQKQLDKYSLQKNDKLTSDAAKTAQEQVDIEVKISNDQAKAAMEIRAKKIENKQALLDIEKDGFSKNQQQLLLNHEKELLAVDKYAYELIERQQDAERLKWEKSGKRGTFTPSTITEKQLPSEEKDILTAMRTASDLVYEGQNQELINTLVKQYQDYSSKRIELETKFSTDLASMYDANGNLLSGITQSTIDELHQQWTEALATLDNEFLRTKTSIEVLFDDLAKKTPAQMRDIASQAQAMAEFISGGNFDAAQAGQFGIKTEAQFKQLNAEWAKSPDKLAAIKKAIDELYSTADQSENAFKKMQSGLQKIFSSSGKTDIETGLSLLSEGLSSVIKMADLFSDSLRNIGELAGNDTFSAIADGISNVMDVAGSVMGGAQAGAAFGPVGAAVGAALGLISSVTKIFAENKKHREELKKQIQENNELAYFGELEVNRLWRDRYEWTMKIGEAELKYIQRNGEELKKQSAANVSEQSKLWAKLLGQEYKAGEHFEETGLFGWGKGKNVADWVSLAGKTWDEIEMLAGQGKLSEEGMKYYEALKAAKEEGDDLAKRQEEYLEEVRETFTGSTYDSLVTGIIDGFKQGKRSAADFAETFEELMSGAVSSALQLASDEKIRAYYEEFADLSKDGLTEEEITYLRDLWNELITGIAAEAKQLEEVTGTGTRSVTQSGKSGAYETASQESITRLEGLYSSMLEYQISIDSGVENIIENMSAALEHLRRIEEHTGNSNEHLGKIEKAIEEMKEYISVIKRDGIKTR